MQDDISGWSDWNGAFREIPELNSPSELHGLMTGMLCIAQAPTAEQWQLVLAQVGLSLAQMDVIELNEAFAAQVLACLRAWTIADDDTRVNARGGGISMGHPLGMSGARIAGTAARRLAEGGGRSALVTLCVGVGQGVALELLAV